MLRLLDILIVLAVFILGLFFYMNNSYLIEINYYFGQVNLPVSLVLFIVLFSGALIGILVMVPILMQLQREKFTLRRQIKVSKKEIENLRSMGRGTQDIV